VTTTIGPYVVGERPDPLEHTFLDADGVAIDLTDYDASAVLLAPGATEGDEPDVTVPDPDSGTVRVDLGELIDTAGTWRLEVWVDETGGRRYASERFRFYARAALPVPTP
jgi:hypothetical protein